MLVQDYSLGEQFASKGKVGFRTEVRPAPRRMLTPADMFVVGPLVLWATWMQFLCAPFPARTIDWAGQKKLPPDLD